MPDAQCRISSACSGIAAQEWLLLENGEGRGSKMWEREGKMSRELRFCTDSTYTYSSQDLMGQIILAQLLKVSGRGEEELEGQDNHPGVTNLMAPAFETLIRSGLLGGEMPAQEKNEY
jgi:hypothetical protein